MALWVDIDEVNNGPFQNAMVELSKENFLHINVDIPNEVNSNNVGRVMDKVRVLFDLGQGIQNRLVLPTDSADNALQQPRRLFVSLFIPHHASFLIKSLLDSKFYADFWIIVVSGEKNAALNNLLAIDTDMKSSGKPISLGIGGCSEPMELDWFLTKIPAGVLEIVHLGHLQLPNVRTHCIELAHTLGYNSMFQLSPQALDKDVPKSQHLQELAAKYGIQPDQYLLKYLLQLGCVVSVPYKHIGADSVIQQYSRMCHPFVHRRPFVSANKVISLLIQPGDMAVLSTASEVHEAQADSLWTPHTKNRTADRELTYNV